MRHKNLGLPIIFLWFQMHVFNTEQTGQSFRNFEWGEEGATSSDRLLRENPFETGASL
jgi:hypothetical protein